MTVLQMANSPDVTDQTLESLRGLKALKELDLNDTQMTDAGLVVLRDLPSLERLRLARTGVTDRGFRDALFDKDSLMQLDLQGTQVSHETMRAWRDAKTRAEGHALARLGRRATRSVGMATESDSHRLGAPIMSSRWTFRSEASRATPCSWRRPATWPITRRPKRGPVPLGAGAGGDG